MMYTEVKAKELRCDAVLYWIRHWKKRFFRSANATIGDLEWHLMIRDGMTSAYIDRNILL